VVNYIFGDFLAQRFKRERERERQTGCLKLIFFKLGRLDEGHQTDHVQRRFHAARTHMERHT
jgi:hypothetical protein